MEGRYILKIEFKKKKACQGSNIGVEGEGEIKVTLSLGLNNMVRGEYLEMGLCV